MPQVFPVTASTMNYASPILVTVCGLSWIWYRLHWVSLVSSRTFWIENEADVPCFGLQHQYYHGPGGQMSELSSQAEGVADVKQDASL